MIFLCNLIVFVNKIERLKYHSELGAGQAGTLWNQIVHQLRHEQAIQNRSVLSASRWLAELSA